MHFAKLGSQSCILACTKVSTGPLNHTGVICRPFPACKWTTNISCKWSEVCLGSRPDSRSRSKAVSLWRAFIRDCEGCRSFSTLSLVQVLQNGSVAGCRSQLYSLWISEPFSQLAQLLTVKGFCNSEAKFTKKFKRRTHDTGGNEGQQEPRSKIFLPQVSSRKNHLKSLTKDEFKVEILLSLLEKPELKGRNHFQSSRNEWIWNIEIRSLLKKDDLEN